LLISSLNTIFAGVDHDHHEKAYHFGFSLESIRLVEEDSEESVLGIHAHLLKSFNFSENSYYGVWLVTEFLNSEESHY
jgi:hypothetical protein